MVAPRSGAWTARTLLVAALAAGLALLAPAACLAGGGRSAPADPVFTRYISGLLEGRTPQPLGLAPAPVSRTGVPRVHYAPLMASFPERFAPADAVATDTPGRDRVRRRRDGDGRRGGVRPASSREAHAHPRPGTLGHVLGVRRTRLARVEPAARRCPRLLGEQHGQPRRVRARVRRRRQQLHGRRLPAALGRAGGRGRRPVRSLRRHTALLAARRRGGRARARGAHAPRQDRRHRQRGPQVGRADPRRRLHHHVLDGVGLPRRDRRVLLQELGRQSRRLGGRLGRRGAREPVRHRPRRPRRVPRAQQLGRGLRQRRLLLGLLLRHVVRRPERRVRRRRAGCPSRADLPARPARLDHVVPAAGRDRPVHRVVRGGVHAGGGGIADRRRLLRHGAQRGLRGPRRGLRGGHPGRRRPCLRDPCRPRLPHGPAGGAGIRGRRAAGRGRRACHRAGVPVPGRDRAAVRRVRGRDRRSRAELRERRRRHVDRHDDAHRRHRRVPQGLRPGDRPALSRPGAGPQRDARPQREPGARPR